MIHLLAEKPFLSIQGEGIHAGRPSIFVRYAGCNLRCQFGLKCANLHTERDIPDNIKQVISNIDKYNSVDELPVFPNYCDTYIGILPEFSKFWIKYETTDDLVKSILGLIENNKDNYPDLSNVDIVFTGGEPMLHQNHMIDLVNKLIMYKLSNITIETNGTIPMKNNNDWKIIGKVINITFSVSPKISSANYTMEETCHPEVVKEYSDYCDNLVLKYVVSDENDISNVKIYSSKYKEVGTIIDEICLMPCGGKADENFNDTQRRIFDLCVKYGYRYSTRLQMIKLNSWGV